MLSKEGAVLLTAFGGSLVYQMIGFFIAYTFQVDKFTDLAGSSNFILLVIGTFFAMERWDSLRHILLTAAVCVWALRLGSYLVFRVFKRGHDARFDKMRSRWQHFIIFWIFQLVWAYVGSLPVMLFNVYVTVEQSQALALNPADIIGGCLFIVGLVLETIADFHKYYHNSKPVEKRRPTPFISTGVYAFVRYPNYLGEICLWTGLFVVGFWGIGGGAGGTLWIAAAFTALSPLLTILLLTRVSGVPKAEAEYERRYGEDPLWIAYKQRSGTILPSNPKYVAMTIASTAVLCCGCCVAAPTTTTPTSPTTSTPVVMATSGSDYAAFRPPSNGEQP